MKEKSVKKNYFYNLIYQLLTLILPLITTPYISRVLGAEKIGIYSYTTSVVTYFILFGSLGVSMYGQREIAYIGEDIGKRKKSFWEIVILRFITLAIATLIYYFTIIRTAGEYKIYYEILLFYLLASAFDISWFLQGLEEFKKTVMRNLIVRTTSVMLIFVLVKQPNDLSKYLLIYSLADLIGNLSLWAYLPKYLEGEKIEKISVFRHFIPIMILFVPQIAVKVYNIMDKTMLGKIIGDKAELGNYEEAYKIINVLLTIIASLSLVMVPKIASLYHKGERQRLKIYLNKSFNFMFFLTFPMMFGIISVAKEFIPFFLGTGYEIAAKVTVVIAPLLVLSGISNIIGVAYLLPTKKHKEYTVSICVGIVVNVILNAFLILKYKAIGVAIATVISQIFVDIFQIYYIRNEIRIKDMLKMAYKYFIASLGMFIICQIVSIFIHADNIISVIVKAGLGVISYAVFLVLLKDDYIKSLKGTVKSLILRE